LKSTSIERSKTSKKKENLTENQPEINQASNLSQRYKSQSLKKNREDNKKRN